MGLILYRCPDDLPAGIPDILSRLSSPPVCVGGPEDEPDPDESHRYLVERGMGRISIATCREGGLTTVIITEPSLNPMRLKPSHQLRQEVIAALEKAGIRELTVEELEQLDRELRENNG